MHAIVHPELPRQVVQHVRRPVTDEDRLDLQLGRHQRQGLDEQHLVLALAHGADAAGHQGPAPAPLVHALEVRIDLAGRRRRRNAVRHDGDVPRLDAQRLKKCSGGARRHDQAIHRVHHLHVVRGL